MKRYRQLTLDERYQIQALLALGQLKADIARNLGRHRSTIGREIRRNGGQAEFTRDRWYRAKAANCHCHQRRTQKAVNSRKINGPLKELIEQKLRLSWSPEQISGRLKLEKGIQISHETIYQHVLRDTHRYPNPGTLRYCLRFSGYKHSRFKKSRCAEKTRASKHFLENRPESANQRKELGHWERDLVEGPRNSRACLLTIIDRKSRYVLIQRVNRKTENEVASATQEALVKFKHLNRTLTNDNGVEFQRAQNLERQLKLPIYYTDPGCPWQRGSIENANGLIRQYFRKRERLDNYPSWFAKAIEQTLNHRPRKILGFKTPSEVFYKKQMSLMSGSLLRLGLEYSPST